MDSNDTPLNTETSLSNLNLANVPPLLVKALQSNLTEADREKVSKAIFHLRVLEHGAYAAIPLHCKGDSCTMADNCPFLKAGIRDMIGEQCPLEKHLLDRWIQKYIDTLKIDPSNIVDMSCIGEIAKIDIYEMRMNNRLAYEDVVTKQVAAMDNEGNIQYRDELHIAAQWMDMMSKRKSKLLESLLATRKAIADAGGGLDASDPSSQASRLLDTVKRANLNLQKRADTLKAESAKKVN